MTGDEDDPLTTEDWIKKSKENLKAARVLSRAGLENKAFLDAGMAVECSLKYAVMRAAGLNSWPTHNERRELHTHDLPALARIAGLEPRFLKEVEQVTSLGLAWMVVKDWKVGTRYSMRSFPKVRSRQMIKAAEEVTQWLQSQWL